jgi:hypothetical protein
MRVVTAQLEYNWDHAGLSGSVPLQRGSSVGFPWVDVCQSDGLHGVVAELPWVSRDTCGVVVGLYQQGLDEVPELAPGWSMCTIGSSLTSDEVSVRSMATLTACEDCESISKQGKESCRH